MAINKAMRAVLGAITALDPDVEKTYKFERRMEKLTARMRGSADDYSILDNPIWCHDHIVPVRVFLPAGEGPFPVILFFHGGGWVTGGIDNYTGVCLDLVSATGHAVASVDYRLAPEYKFPAAPEDCYAVAREFFLGKVMDVSPDDITLMGDSAGGNLAAAVSLMARDRGEFLPRRQILAYPSTYNDHSENSPFASVQQNGTDYLLSSKRVEAMSKLYQGAPEDLQNPYFAPLLAKDFSNQPKTLIITAEFCPLRDEGEYYGKKLQDAGGEVEVLCVKDALHAFLMLPARFNHVKQAHEAIRSFLDRKEAL